MIKKWQWYVGFFVLLFAGYFLFVSSQEGFSKSPLPVISNVQPFSFINQEGKKLSDKEVEGKVYVTEYFFTTCKGICPKMNANMRRVYDTYKNEDDFMIVSHTCMPETDSVPILKKIRAADVERGCSQKNDDGSYKIADAPANTAIPVNKKLAVCNR